VKLQYKEKTLSLVAAARLSGLSLTQFVDHLAGLGIGIVCMDETIAQKTQDISAWDALIVDAGPFVLLQLEPGGSL